MAKCHTKSLFGDDQIQSSDRADAELVRVAFENGADSVFDYIVPDKLWPVDIGQRVEVPFGRKNKLMQAFVVAIVSEEEKAALTERMGPSGILRLLNEYFEAMVQILERHGGIVTQFQGDAILATFNVPLEDPDHAAGALRAALEMQEVARTRRFAGERLSCRIGINTGPVVAGAVGAKGRLSYTVHGDAVNLAARLEAMNKDFGTSILVSAETALRVRGFRFRPVGEAVVRGQTRPARVFELVGTEDDA